MTRLHLRSPQMAVAGLVLAVVGCHRRARTPEEAFARFERAVAAGDPLQLWEVLDQSTRVSIESTYRDQRLQRTVISARYPESAAGPALAHLEPAAAEDAAHYFASIARERRLVEGLRRRLGSVSGQLSLRPGGDGVAEVGRADGVACRFARGADGSWGFSEWAADWRLEQERASHALSTVRENARLYEQAGGP